ncbi:MAG TPA: hypothetical protein VEG36_04300 [Burkholderiales bacterium]|nr:hypothetical protein [Burkholderiales bacterium]
MNDMMASVYSIENRVEIQLYPLDVFLRTQAGAAALRGQGPALPAEAIDLLRSLDGTRDVGELERKMAHLAPQRVRNILRALLGARLARAATLAEQGGINVDFEAFFGRSAGG